MKVNLKKDQNPQYWRKLQLGITNILIVGSAIAPPAIPGIACCDYAVAQIVPDTTLGSESSLVTPQAPGSNVDLIQGGAIRDTNLFHSFEQFSVLSGRTAYFNNSSNIQNIISRVTGSSISDINGVIKANGTANLFLINPHGIIFGPNARLEIGGSFVGSTANSVNFADGSSFSATAPQSSLLTVSVPLGLQFGATAGRIVNQSRAANNSGLQVPLGKTLTLLGGNVEVNNGILQAPNGRIQLGGLLEPGIVGLNNDTSLSFPVGVQPADVLLTNAALLNVSSSNGGNITINARNLDILGGSTLRANRQQGSGSVNTQAGDITLNATEAINITNNSLINTDVGNRAIGNGGNINITANSLLVNDGARLTTNTSGIQSNVAGNVNIFVRERVAFDGVGVSLNGAGNPTSVPSGIVSRVVRNAVGDGGDINITSGSLSITNGASLSASTNGRGDVGNVTINTRDTVVLDGGINRDNEPIPSEISSVVDDDGIGNGGAIQVTTGSLSITNGARINANTNGEGDAGRVTINARDRVSLSGVGMFSNNTPLPSAVLSSVGSQAEGNGGNINVTTGSLFATNGARLTTNSFGQGNAGNVTINARDTVSFEGAIRNADSGGAFSLARNPGTGNGGSINVTTGSFSATNGARLNAGLAGQGTTAGSITVNARDTVFLDGVGINTNNSGIFGAVTNSNNLTVNESVPVQGGNLMIKTGQLIIQNGASINALSTRLGSAGEIQIEADSIEINDGSKIQAEARRSQGGNINLQVRDLILMRRQGLISAASGGLGNGGNVTIGDANNTPLIVAFPDENSDIIAQATEGQGGNIDIFTQGIFGLAERNPTTLETSDINASSEVGTNGTVEINRLDIDPSQGLTTLPIELVDASNQIVASCATTDESVARNQFIITGRGGLPPSPTDTLSDEAVLTEWVSLEPNIDDRFRAEEFNNFTRQTPSQIVEAQAWVVDSQGEVILIASAPTVIPNSSGLVSTSCNGS